MRRRRAGGKAPKAHKDRSNTAAATAPFEVEREAGHKGGGGGQEKGAAKAKEEEDDEDADMQGGEYDSILCRTAEHSDSAAPPPPPPPPPTSNATRLSLYAVEHRRRRWAGKKQSCSHAFRPALSSPPGITPSHAHSMPNSSDRNAFKCSRSTYSLAMVRRRGSRTLPIESRERLASISSS